MNARAQRNAGTTGYSVREICRLVGISARQLGYWRLIGAVAPRVERHGAKTFYRYTDKDLRLLREVARLTAIGLPRQLVAFLGGYGFGFVWGTALATASAATGCIIAFFYARLMGRDLVKHRFQDRIKHVDDFLHDNPFTMTLLIRFLPLGSNLLTNLAAGVSSVRPLPFIAGSALGYVPQMLIFALAGSGVTLDPVFRISVSAVLFVLSGVIGIHLYRKYRHGKTLDDTLEHDLGDAAGADAQRRDR